MQLADFLSAVFFYLKVGENLNQNWIVENLNNALFLKEVVSRMDTVGLWVSDRMKSDL